MQVICLEDSAFYELVDQVVQRLKEKNDIKNDKWVTDEVAMRRLNIKSKSTLQKLRDEGRIRFSQPQPRIILYDTDSIDIYLERNAKNPFRK
ncbi:helix-turn-helix domain-containing protein [Emticicia fluvialis]|uniref:helix-turn-helix domain-containing protein n=1 Tax=Emticicia fluvialis TaxID=2974474 RepID=UPI00216531C7|nr:helix-turn-helix domain-containing protein [Emticicia fluvialis]